MQRSADLGVTLGGNELRPWPASAKGSGTEFTYCYGLPMYFAWDTTQLPAAGVHSGAAGALSGTP